MILLSRGPGLHLGGGGGGGGGQGGPFTPPPPTMETLCPPLGFQPFKIEYLGKSPRGAKARWKTVWGGMRIVSNINP